MKQKILSVLLSAVVVAAMLAGCTSKTEKAATEPASESSETTEEAAAESGEVSETTESGDGTLTVWAWDKSFNIYAMEEAEKIYQKEHPDFSLNIVEVSWDDMQTTLGTILSSGDYSQLPDILLMQDFAFRKYASTYTDFFTDLTDSGIAFDEFAEGKLGMSMVDGKNYGVPFDNGAEVAVYRTDILEQAGYTIDDLTDIDWDRFIEIGKDVLDKTGYSLVSSQAGSSDIIMQMLQSAGGSIWNGDGTPGYVENETLKKCMEVYKELFDTGVMETGNNWDEYIATFTSGKTAGVINGCWILASIESAEEQSGLWAVTNMPSLPGVEGATNYSNQGGSSWGITTNCSDVELAEDFFASTFAGSVELYDTILPGAGALATWIPAADSDVYSEPQEFYGGEAVFELITDFASKVPEFDMGVYYTEANTALATAVTNVCAGGDIDSELQTAEDTVNFDMGN